MYEYRYGGREAETQQLQPASEFVAVQVPQESLESLEALEGALEQLPQVKRIIRFEGAGILVLKPSGAPAAKPMRESVLESLDDTSGVLAPDRVLRDESGEPVVYTNRIYVRFVDGAADVDIDAALAPFPIESREPVPLNRRAFILTIPEAQASAVFDVANRLLDNPQVSAAHPELLRESRHREASKKQWHLRKIEHGNQSVDQHCNALAAWARSTGKDVVIAVIDDGVDTTHTEFEDKVIHPFDATRKKPEAAPRRRDENHGTACAGVACAAGKHRAAGVAPGASLMPIRLASGLGSLDELEAFKWAVDHGADIISCSWGPADGDWWDDADPVHSRKVQLADSSRDAIAYAIEHGRGGKGCVIVWAAGNGNESVDLDGYAAHRDVITVAACNDRGTRSIYSDFGKAVWCTFPSNDFEHPSSNHAAPLTPGIWTTDRRGAQGYNAGHLTPGDDDEGDPDGHYTASFGGTSSACPGVAGLVALMLAVNQSLTPGEVKDLLRQACVKIDPAGGNYDPEGHSVLYGFGRPDADVAVQLASSFSRAV